MHRLTNSLSLVQNETKMRGKHRLEAIVRDIVNEHVDANNEAFYREIMLCMAKLAQLFIDKACPLVKEAAAAADGFWASFIPYENFPTMTIDVEYARLSKFIDEGKNRNQDSYARAVRLMVRTFDEEFSDDNIDVFPLFVDYLIKMGCYRESISDIIERSIWKQPGR